MTVTIEELIERDVLFADPQLDYLRNPFGRSAVAVYGVPAPDHLYAGGYMEWATLNQKAWPGTPDDGRGYQPVVLPVVIEGLHQDGAEQSVRDWWGCVDDYWPSVYGEGYRTDWSWHWQHDEFPFQFLPFDIWPIEDSEKDLWATASMAAYGESKMELIWEYWGWMNSGDELTPPTEEFESLESKCVRAKDPQERALLEAERSRLQTAYMQGLEAEIFPEDSGCWDPQVPPPYLPPEQAAVWHSLQVLSQRNWDLLAKQASGAGSALYGSRFVEANRRLCPWY